MHIYLDIDGVILGTASPMKDIEDLLTLILDRFPDSVYWLTTHCRGGENRTGEWLRGKLKEELVERLEKSVRPTDWNVLKTEAIDFSTPFLWLDDELLYSERKALQIHGATDNWIVMNKRDPCAARNAMQRILDCSP